MEGTGKSENRTANRQDSCSRMKTIDAARRAHDGTTKLTIDNDGALQRGLTACEVVDLIIIIIIIIAGVVSNIF